eukprot:59422-Amphidinium_carterae.2
MQRLIVGPCYSAATYDTGVGCVGMRALRLALKDCCGGLIAQRELGRSPAGGSTGAGVGTFGVGGATQSAARGRVIPSCAHSKRGSKGYERLPWRGSFTKKYDGAVGRK